MKIKKRESKIFTLQILKIFGLETEYRGKPSQPAMILKLYSPFYSTKWKWTSLQARPI